MRRLLVPSAALLWGLQFAFLNPALALLLVTRALGAALLEIPALLLVGRLNRRFSSLALIGTGCVAGIVYYAAMAAGSGPVLLLGLQVLNAVFFAAVGGVGLTLFQQVIARPGLASGLYTNTRRLGAIVSLDGWPSGSSRPTCQNSLRSKAVAPLAVSMPNGV